MSNGLLFDNALNSHPLYVILDRNALDKYNANILEVMAGAIKAGVKLFQVRSKKKDQRFLDEVKRCVQLAAQNDCFVAINDYMDVAKKFGTSVHLGQDDIRRVNLSSEDIYGLSTRNIAEIKSAMGQLNRPLYVGFGSCFATESKNHVVLQSKHSILEASESVSVPIIFIGGITMENVKSLPFHKQVGFAVIKDIFRYGIEESDIEYYCYCFKSKVYS